MQHLQVGVCMGGTHTSWKALHVERIRKHQSHVPDTGCRHSLQSHHILYRSSPFTQAKGGPDAAGDVWVREREAALRGDLARADEKLRQGMAEVVAGAQVVCATCTGGCG